jgi:hypothetical protein
MPPPITNVAAMKFIYTFDNSCGSAGVPARRARRPAGRIPWNFGAAGMENLRPPGQSY